MSHVIDLQIEDDTLKAPSAQDLQRWVDIALQDRPDGAELTIRIVDKAESQTLNSNYRGKDKPTNVLSFPFEAPPEVDLNLLGDLVICAPVVEEEALEQGKTLLQHWAHMVIHGVLHLLGYDHLDDAQAEQMESLETRLLAELGFPDPYQS